MLHGVRAASSFLSLMPLSLSLSLLLCAQLRYIYAYRGSKTHRDVKSRERAFSSSLCFVITAAPLFNLTATYLHLLYSCLNFLLAMRRGEEERARIAKFLFASMHRRARQQQQPSRAGWKEKVLPLFRPTRCWMRALSCSCWQIRF